MRRKLPFKYYAIRVLGMVIFRRTVNHLSKVESRLYKPGTSFVLTQVTYTGGRIVGSMSYRQWTELGGRAFSSVMKVSRDQYHSMLPYMQKVQE